MTDTLDEDYKRELRKKRVIGLLKFSLIGGILGLIFGILRDPPAPIGGFVIGYLLFLISLVVILYTKLDRRRLLGRKQQQQQQQQVDQSSEPTVVCSECGWENTKDNNYCHDCGSKLNE
jgi:uncharacterized paraquat-inducible protein A